MSDYEKTYDDFWKEIVENPDGTLNIDQVKKELGDYAFVMDEASKVYDELTNGRVSKPNTMAHAVIAEANEVTQEWLDDQLVEWTKALIDVFEEADDDETPGEIRERIFDSLGISES